MARREPGDDGVSPVVGMILVLGISVVGISAILYWGLPAIDEMKANVEHKSIESQFAEFDASIRELVAGTTEKTAKRWQPTLNRGSLVITNESEMWVYATELYDPDHEYDFGWLGFGDKDNAFTIENRAADATGDVAVFTIEADRLHTTSSGQTLVVSEVDAGNTDMTPTDFLHGESATYYLRDEGGKAVDLDNSTIRLRVLEDGDTIAEAWFVPTGRVDYELKAGLGTKTVVENNGAIISGDGRSHAISNSPPVPPVGESNGIPRFFGRAVILNGTGGFSGDDRYNMLLTLHSTVTLASYDCAETDLSDCVVSTKFFIWGDQRETWHALLTNEARGYEFVEATAGAGGADEMTFLEQRETAMGYTLLQSRIQLTATAGG